MGDRGARPGESRGHDLSDSTRDLDETIERIRALIAARPGKAELTDLLDHLVFPA